MMALSSAHLHTASVYLHHMSGERSCTVCDFHAIHVRTNKKALCQCSPRNPVKTNNLLFCVVNHHTESTQKPLRWDTKEVTSIISTWERRAGRDGKEKTAMGAECRARPSETPVRHMTRQHKATCQVPPTIFRWAPSKKSEWTPTCSSTG